MGLILPSIQTRQPQINRGLSALARSLGFTHAWNWGSGGVAPYDAGSNSQTFSVINNATAVTGLGGRAVQFNGTSSDRLEIVGNPFATATCTYLWVESGVDATGPGQSFTNSKYSTSAASETGSLQIRMAGTAINILQAQVAATLVASGARDNTGKVNVSALSVAGNNGRHVVFTNGQLIASATPASAYVHGTSAVGGGSDCPSSTIKTYVLLFAPSVIPDTVLQDLTRNPWKLLQASQRKILVDAIASGTDTPVNPGVGTLSLTGYIPSVAQSANQSLTPGAGSISITGYAPSISQPQAITAGAGALTLTGYAPTVTQGITTNIVPGAGALNLTGYAPSIAQSANQNVMPSAGSLSIGGYAPAIAQTANQSIAPAPGSLTLMGYAPTVAQALASPNLVPEVGALSITGYAPTVEQRAPITKIGGDDAPRHDEEDERVEVWEKRAPTPRRDDSLDKVIREAYAKAIGKPAAPAVAKAEPKPVALDEPVFDVDEEDDLEVLLLSL